MFGGEFLLLPVTLRLTASHSDFQAASLSTVDSMLSGPSPPTSPGQVAGSGADTPDTSADDFATEVNDFMHFTGAEPPKYVVRILIAGQCIFILNTIDGQGES